MSITKGLRKMQEKQDHKSVKWLKIPDGSSYRVRFLDDLDESADTNLHGAGVAVMLEEHTSPQDFRRKALCTRDEEGRCWACEQATKAPRTGWGKRGRVYVNVLVNDGNEEPYVAIWSMGIAKSPAFETLKETYIDDGSISNREWRIKRSGSGTNTTYILRDLGVEAEPFNFTQFEKFDTETIVRHVPYSEQESFYGAGQEVSEAALGEEW
jgi:hypothetical protein